MPAAMRVPVEERAVALREMTRVSPVALADMVEQVFAYHLDESLRDRPHRVLAMAGSMDVAAIRRTVRRVGEMMPAARATIVPRGLHAWNWQYPELFNQTVAEWLSRDP
jgi:pimeloyl-ACP methyl ester carboxylesterase